ncbi:PREDICTED: uncharacterized protein LOC104779176 [Camelina sativa]|uniref:Uncharacterized protein LOC104779176 n=1 Tax=Camelina sativa TaxID=90675 RepID=A0ABM0YJC7_CAMSA|nr:PREDICTED: uncharacterized protein LOC104779176 [Camelina sativa]
MHPDKASGPDGMTAFFYQKAWATVKADLVLLVNSFLRNGDFDKRLNVTNICLIPKVDKPTRMTELRPISLCNVEVLIAHFRKAERLKLLTGIKVLTASPAISHLLFVDDSLFFCRATKEQCEVVLDILKKYEWVYGQQINFQKFSFQFGHTVDSNLREELKGVLGITNLGGMGSYLGIPESLGGAKTKIFSFVQDKLQARASGWPARLLSKGGKEVMIKYVATAVPTFVMSCFRLPKTVTRKLTSAISNFWWSSSGQSRGLHWVAWDKPCNGKDAGGLGFRCLDDYNTALLAKQLRCLITVPESFFARFFKGRYYRLSDPLDPIKSYSSSYGWRSFCSLSG